MTDILSKQKTVRNHDSFYAEENLDSPVKDSFVKVADFIEIYKANTSSKIKIADIGCAAGAFPGYLSKRFSDDSIHGYEYLANLVETAKENFPNINFLEASVLDKGAINENEFDVITLLGVLSIFDNVEPVLDNLLRWIKPGGKILLHGMFNPQDVDVYLRYNLSEDYDQDTYETGWNIISQRTITNLLLKKNIVSHKFHKFQLSVDLKPNKNDPLRSWTSKDSNNERNIINGLCLDQPQYILEINN